MLQIHNWFREGEAFSFSLILGSMTLSLNQRSLQRKEFFDFSIQEKEQKVHSYLRPSLLK